MLVTDDEVLATHVRHLATHAREPALHYEHRELGFNYRLSNLLAALGRAQLAGLSDRIARRRAIDDRYRTALEGIDGIEFLPRAPWGTSNHWLTCLTIGAPWEPRVTRDAVIDGLAEEDIEARPTWKPMHRQPLYRGAPALITGVADWIFDCGLCLPTGSDLSVADQERVVVTVRSVLGQR
jgi:dTDP-4-amino-4,6-dideoxygalactose transaminase